MTKKLDDELEEELFTLHKNCWNPDKTLRCSSITDYAKKISELYREGYIVEPHTKFVYYYHSKILGCKNNNNGHEKAN